MTIYIANTTKQNFHHHYRLPEMTRPFYVRLESGNQIKIGEDWNTTQTNDFIKRLEKFGAQKASSVSGKLENFPGLFYSTDKPISESQIVGGHEAVVDGQERRSAAEATKSALGFDAANRDRKRGGKRLAKLTEVTVKQDVPRNEKPTGKEVEFSVGVSEDGSSNAKLPV